ncbi:MAG: hypothetical protein OEW05_06900 [Candidatus Aminicenantes bacterium]|nr:hypothetical protein [Candidatus Aminicenantes bacterium]
MNERPLTLYRILGLSLAAVFALVGGLFLFLPGEVMSFFNVLSRRLGMTPIPQAGRSFFGVLAAAYMYLVTVLAWGMFRSPRERVYPLLLGQAKLASSLLSFGLFLFHAPWLIYLVNGIVDGAIGLLVLKLAFKIGPEVRKEIP